MGMPQQGARSNVGYGMPAAKPMQTGAPAQQGAPTMCGGTPGQSGFDGSGGSGCGSNGGGCMGGPGATTQPMLNDAPRDPNAGGPLTTLPYKIPPGQNPMQGIGGVQNKLGYASGQGDIGWGSVGGGGGWDNQPSVMPPGPGTQIDPSWGQMSGSQMGGREAPGQTRSPGAPGLDVGYGPGATGPTSGGTPGMAAANFGPAGQSGNDRSALIHAIATGNQAGLTGQGSVGTNSDINAMGPGMRGWDPAAVMADYRRSHGIGPVRGDPGYVPPQAVRKGVVNPGGAAAGGMAPNPAVANWLFGSL